MSLQSLRIRRVLSFLSYVPRSLSSSVTTATPPPFSTIKESQIPTPKSQPFSVFQSRSFTGSRASLMSARKKELKVWQEGEEISEDTILFEGCDYEHWLITMDFDMQNKPSPEEMVATYEETCAKGLGISVEEAKKRMYACSTTTYRGFQAVMTEEESKKFEGLPGVVFVLPDSYIDPVNKEYGGDKYENGVITHRLPPVQYRKVGSRDRNRNPGQDQRYDRQRGPVPNQQGRPQYGQHGPVQGGGWNHGHPQNYAPQPNYGPPGQGERTDSYQSNRASPSPQYQGYYNQGQQGNHYYPEQRNFPQENQRDHESSGRRDFRGDYMNYSPTPAGSYGQATTPSYGQGASHGYGHGPNPGFDPGSNPGTGQGANPGFGQGHTSYGQGGSGADYGQRQPGSNQGFSQMDQHKMQGDQWNRAPTLPPPPNQGRY